MIAHSDHRRALDGDRAIGLAWTLASYTGTQAHSTSVNCRQAMTGTIVEAGCTSSSNRCTAASHAGYMNMTCNFRPDWLALDFGAPGAFDECTRFGREEYNCASTEEATYATPHTILDLIARNDDYPAADLVRMPECEDIVNPSEGKRASGVREMKVEMEMQMRWKSLSHLMTSLRKGWQDPVRLSDGDPFTP